MQVFDAMATRAALPFGRLIAALQSMFATGCTVPKRRVHEIVSADGLQFTSLIMPAWLEGRFYGVKTINIAHGNAKLGLPGLHASYEDLAAAMLVFESALEASSHDPRSGLPVNLRTPGY